MVIEYENNGKTSEETAERAAMLSGFTKGPSTNPIVAVGVRTNGDHTHITNFINLHGIAALFSKRFNFLEADMSVSLLGEFSSLPGVESVNLVARPSVPDLSKPPPLEELPVQLRTEILSRIASRSSAASGSQSIISTETDAALAHGADAWHDAGFKGQGIRIGIIDIGFTGFSDLQGPGKDLPSAVKARCYTSISPDVTPTKDINDCSDNGLKHGTAVSEAVMDIAPGVELYIANPKGKTQLELTVDWMKNNKVDVINHSIFYHWLGPGDGTPGAKDDVLAVVAKAVEGEDGMVWINAAGNFGEKDVFFGRYSDSEDQWGDDGWMDFSEKSLSDVPVDTNRVWIRRTGEYNFDLRWKHSDPSDPADLNAYFCRDLYCTFENVVAVGRHPEGYEDDQLLRISGKDFVQGPDNDYSYDYGYIRIWHSSGAKPEWVQLLIYGPNTDVAKFLLYWTPHYSIITPGDSSAPGSMAVGAARAYDLQSSVPKYNLYGAGSRGPLPNGAVKPEIVGDHLRPSTSIDPFYGTSQAAAHISGLAALVLQRFPSKTPSQVSEYLKQHAKPQPALPNDPRFEDNPSASDPPNNSWGWGFGFFANASGIGPSDGESK